MVEVDATPQATAMAALDGNAATANAEVEGGAAAAMVEHWSWTAALRPELHDCIIAAVKMGLMRAPAKQPTYPTSLCAQPMGVHEHNLSGLGHGHRGQPTSTCSLMLDSPVGSGFSFARDPKGYDVGDYSSSSQVQTFLNKVMRGIIDVVYRQSVILF